VPGGGTCTAQAYALNALEGISPPVETKFFDN